MAVETQGRDPDPDHVDREGARVGTATGDRVRRDAPAQQAVILLEDEFKAGPGCPRAGVRDELTHQRLTSRRQEQGHFHDWPMVE